MNLRRPNDHLHLQLTALLWKTWEMCTVSIQVYGYNLRPDQNYSPLKF